MTPSANLTALQSVYEIWHETKGEGDRAAEAWLGLLADDFRILSVNEEAPGMAFAKSRNSKQEALHYIMSLLDEWKMIRWSPKTYVSQGDNITMFGSCVWQHKSTGKIADCRTAHLWKFKDGKAVELTEVFDSARAVAAATP